MCLQPVVLKMLVKLRVSKESRWSERYDTSFLRMTARTGRFQTRPNNYPLTSEFLRQSSMNIDCDKLFLEELTPDHHLRLG